MKNMYKMVLLLAAVANGLVISAADGQNMQQPAHGVSNFQTYGTTIQTVFGPTGYVVAWPGINNYISVATTLDGYNFSNSQQIGGTDIGGVPAGVVSSNGSTIYEFYKDDSDSTLKVVSSNNAVNWSYPIQIQQAGGAGPLHLSTSPAATLFNGQIRISYGDANGSLQVSTTDGTNILSTSLVTSNYTVSTTPSMTVVASQPQAQLVIGFQAGNHMLVTEGSYDGAGFLEQPYPGILMGSSPSLSPYYNQLLLSFQSNDNYHVLFQSSGQNSTSLQSPAPALYKNIQMAGAPFCTFNASNSRNTPIICSFQSNDQYHWSFFAYGN